MSTFNLRALVRDVCDTSPDADPTMLAKEVNRRIGRKDRDAALEQALRPLVQQMLGQLRMAPSEPAPTGQFANGDHGGPAGGGAQPKPSRKVAGIRNAWQRMLRDRINVGAGAADWKFLGDCTATDLDYAASLREDLARRNTARACQYRDLAGLLAAHQVTTVAELPESVLAAETGDAA